MSEDAVLHQLERLKHFDLGKESRRRWFRWGSALSEKRKLNYCRKIPIGYVINQETYPLKSLTPSAKRWRAFFKIFRFTDSQLKRERRKMIKPVQSATTVTTTETFGGVCASVTGSWQNRFWLPAKPDGEECLSVHDLLNGDTSWVHPKMHF